MIKNIEFIIDRKDKKEYDCDFCQDTGLIDLGKGKGVSVCKICLKSGKLG